MRELKIVICFTRPCLGHARAKHGRHRLLRAPDGRIMFLSTWQQQNMRLAAQLLGRHQAAVERIHWAVTVDGEASREDYQRHYADEQGRARLAWHEAIMPGQCVTVRCAVPSEISDDDVRLLMELAGRYKGLSPWRPGEYGHFSVCSVAPGFARLDERPGTKTMPPVAAATGV